MTTTMTMTPKTRVERNNLRWATGKGGQERFLGAVLLAMEWKFKDHAIPTMAVNGKQVFVNEKFIGELSDDELLGVQGIHEPLHIILGHPADMLEIRERLEKSGMGKGYIRGAVELFNVAADLVINEFATDNGFKIPAGGCFVGQGPFQDHPAHATAIDHWKILMNKHKDHLDKCDGDGEPGEKGDGEGSSDQYLPQELQGMGQEGKVCCPEPMTGEDGKPETMTSDSLRQHLTNVVVQAAGCMKGDKPGWMKTILDALTPHKSPVNYKEALQRFADQAIPYGDKCYSKLNRRMPSICGCRMPGDYGETLGDIGFLVDTSGSMSDAEVMKCFQEWGDIAAAYPGVTMRIIQCDAAIRYDRTFEADDLPGPDQFAIEGRGGTNFDAAFHEFNESDCVALVVLTDGYVSWPSKNDVPCLVLLTPNQASPDTVPDHIGDAYVFVD